MLYYADSIQGKSHPENEDCYLCPENYKDLWPGNGAMFVVCDGAGANSNGAYAASLVANILMQKWYGTEANTSLNDLLKIIDETNSEFCELASGQYEGMVTTMVVVVIKQDRYLMASMGDSRLYHISNNSIEQVSEDHTLAQHLARCEGYHSSKISELYSSVLLNGVGMCNAVVDLGEFLLGGNDKLLLCTDGLSRNLKEGEILRIINCDEPLAVKLGLMLSIALNKNSSDDISGILIEPQTKRTLCNAG